MMTRCFAFSLCALLAAGCGPQPEQVRARRAASASGASLPAAFTGTLEPHTDPTIALKARTYVTALAGDLVFAGTTAGVVAWSFAEPARPRELATVVLPGSVSGLALVSPSRLAVSTGPTGLLLVDASGAAAGKLERLSDAPWRASDRAGCHAAWNARALGEKHALVACGTGGLAEVELNDPTRLRVSRELALDGYVRDLAVLDADSGVPTDQASPRKVVAAAGSAGLVVAEFPPAGQPRILARLPTTGEARALEVRGGMAYVADGPAGLRIVDLRDPARPVEAGRFEPRTVDLARGVAVRDTTVFLCLGDSGLMALDASQPSAPRRLGLVDPRRAVNRAAVRNNLLFASNDAGGILVLDATNPGSLAQVFPAPAQ
jgi:hypothetical protein